ncbi:MAG: 50S ribosomal protein L18 [Leptospiraceae bacterium]|nr:50S ribosomal protein L18 [Leptospiraceae bacterium]MCK6380145.1 50S ribosomal protein L18 [Leptospiraceae bacterium]
MINKEKKTLRSIKRTKRIRYKIKANSDRPRLVFNKSNKFLIAQIIDDKIGKTLAFAISSEKDFPLKGDVRKNKKSASELGKIIAKRAISNGVKQVVLDRSGMIYHGKVAAFADSAREEGLEF